MATATATKSKGKGKTRAERKREHEEQIANGLKKAEELVPKIKEQHKAVVKSLEDGLEHAIKAGEHLSQAKNLVGHGG